MKRTGSIASTVGPLVTSARTPRERSGGGRQHVLDRRDDLVRLGHAPEPGLAAGHVAGIRPDQAHPVGLHLGDAAPGRGMLPHRRVHRGRDQDGLVGGQERGRRQVIGETMRHLGDQIGGRRGDHDQVRLARQADMADLGLVGQREQVGEHPLPGQAGHRERGDELGAGAGQDAAHAKLALAQSADQLQRLVGGDPAGNDQQNATVLLHRTRPGSGRPPAPERPSRVGNQRHSGRRCAQHDIS